MTLTTRLSVFFLTTLALVLLGFSITLYSLARSHLYGEADSREKSVLDTLVAAADVDSDGVEWNGDKRRQFLDRDTGNADIRWIVLDNHGHTLDRSPNLAPRDVLMNPLQAMATDDLARQKIIQFDEPWRLVQRRVPFSAHGASAISDARTTVSSEDERKFPTIHIMVGVSLRPVQTALHALLMELCGLCAIFWLLAAFCGRWICRRALIPVARMAASARTMRAVDLGQRLPNTETHDELEALSLAFNGLLDRLQESFQRQERFTGDASHQLRTPLTAMLGQIEVALRRDRPPEEYQLVLNRLQGQANRLHQIVEMLFFLAHADAEARFPHLENINLCDWLGEYLESWSDHPRAPDLQVDNRVSHPLTVKVHRSLLGQLIDNLMENACKHSPTGTAITLQLWIEQQLVFLSIEDAGCGIAPDDLPHIFEPFYRSSNARGLGIGGVGLGLSVAQRIAAVFGACISVKSELAKGSSFLLQLPFVGAPAPCPITLRRISLNQHGHTVGQRAGDAVDGG